MHEQKMNQYQELCSTLVIPIMATERLMHDMDLTAQWLIQGATDRLRARATFGLTQVLKLAHFAEMHGANIEMNGPGGLYGLVHAHAGCCIDNTDFYELLGPADPKRLRSEGEEWGLLNAPLIEDGHIAPPPTAPAGAPSGTKTASAHSPSAPTDMTYTPGIQRTEALTPICVPGTRSRPQSTKNWFSWKSPT